MADPTPTSSVDSSENQNEPGDSNPAASRSRHGNRPSPRQTILEALETLERENNELRRTNNSVLGENEQLLYENERLRQELDQLRSEKEHLSSKNTSLIEDNRRLLLDRENEQRRANEEHQERSAMESILNEERSKFIKDSENLGMELGRTQGELRTALRELDNLRRKLDQSSRKNFHDKDVEMFHELEAVKGERGDLARENSELHKHNRKLSAEVKNLGQLIDEKASELRNENIRHTVLTKEFNSLLEENNHLKLQLRRRGAHGMTVVNTGPATGNPDDSSAPLFEINMLPSSRNKNTSGNSSVKDLPSVAHLPRDGSVGHRLRRDDTTASRSKLRTPRDKGYGRAELGQAVLGEAGGGGRTAVKARSQAGSHSDDSCGSPSPDTLPSIGAGSKFKP